MIRGESPCKLGLKTVKKITFLGIGIIICFRRTAILFVFGYFKLCVCVWFFGYYMCLCRPEKWDMLELELRVAMNCLMCVLGIEL